MPFGELQNFGHCVGKWICYNKSAQTAAQIKLEEKVEKYTAPVIAHQHIAQPAVNVAELSDEDKKALLRELLK